MAKVQQKAAASTGDTTSQSVTLDSTPAQNNLLRAYVVSGATVPTPSGWTSAVGPVDFVGLYQFYKIAGAGESTTVTVNPSSSAACVLVVQEWSGYLTSGVLDVVASNSPGGAPTNCPTGTTAATSQADELVTACCGYIAAGETITAWTGYTVDQATLTSTGSASNVALGVATKVVAATGTQAAQADFSTSVSHPSACIATFKAAAAASPAPTQPLVSTAAVTRASTW